MADRWKSAPLAVDECRPVVSGWMNRSDSRHRWLRQRRRGQGTGGKASTSERHRLPAPISASSRLAPHQYKPDDSFAVTQRHVASVCIASVGIFNITGVLGLALKGISVSAQKPP